MCELSEFKTTGSWWSRSLLLIAASVTLLSSAFADDKVLRRRIDPAAWGDDHVGKPLQFFMTGDECLFCHRTIGPAWLDNRHQLTIRPASADEPAIKRLREIATGDELVAETRYLMGSQRIARYLRRSKEYGKLDMLSTSFVPRQEPRGNARQPSKRESIGDLRNSNTPSWDRQAFGDRCAGCHATAVNTEMRAFSALSLDCFTCHGDVDLGHTKGANPVFLSSKSKEPRQIISICGQCHLRGGKSKSSGRPYPNSFVAGDNLFRDFQVDFTDAAIQALPAGDQHIYRVARDVVVFDDSAITCLTCHNVHQPDGVKHQQLEISAICAVCHVSGTGNTQLRDELHPSSRLKVHSRVCDY